MMKDKGEILKAIEYAVYRFWSKYQESPNQVILGAEYAQMIQADSVMLYSEDEAVTVFGIPVQFDYVNPKRIAVGLQLDLEDL